MDCKKKHQLKRLMLFVCSRISVIMLFFLVSLSRLLFGLT
ncbi:hypothetical protein SAMN05421740_102431 [Parapedobacter koreensis]|uniref:Uncharacterized protein n=1 Tax=Parapedobacter koreensis TaxID=332977 RepID=A0A1H7J625_9SPHI|nr:hypothetical protein SAMN05421740_102431 [Parapedobacter koreensis]